MKRLNKKGFTLIELLAVIIILGILMIIAIPSVTSYIQNSRKSAYVDTSAAYVEAVRTKVNEGKEFRLFSTDTLYLIPVGDKNHDTTDQTSAAAGTAINASCVSVESGGQSPFSDTWHYAYVGVTYDGKGYNYYYIGEDGANQGVPFMPFKVLTDEGVGLIYSSTNDESYKTAVTTGVTMHSSMSDTLISKLQAAYKKKDNEMWKSTLAEGETNSFDLTEDDAGLINAIITANEGSAKSVIEVLGTCAS